MTFSFHPEAEKELKESVEYYENIEQGLGYDFSLEVYSAIKRAIDFSEAWVEVDKGIRRSLVHRFPYGVLYTQHLISIIILAVMNLHKKPGYWGNRHT